MQYLDQEGKVVYTSQNGRTSKCFPALEWLAAMSSHIPQMVRYYGWYSNVSRGKRLKGGNDDGVACIIEPLGDEKTVRRNWARLIQKIYEVDPLVCPKCQGAMRIVSSIKDRSVIRDILKYLDLGLSGPGLPQKSMTRQTSNTPTLVFTSNHTLTRSTATRNTPGMITSRHDAQKRRAGEVCPDRS